MNEAFIVIFLFCFYVILGCPNDDRELVFEVCKTDIEIVNGSSSGYLQVAANLRAVDCNCSLQTAASTHLIMALYTFDFFPHSLNVLAGPVTKIAVHSGFVGHGLGSGFINSSQPWLLNLRINSNMKPGSQTKTNQSVCIGFNSRGQDLSIRCRTRFRSSIQAVSPILRHVTTTLAVAVPVLFTVLLLFAVLAFIFYRKSQSSAEYELTKVDEQTLKKRRRKPDKEPSPEVETATNPDVCPGRHLPAHNDNNDSEFPLPPPEAYTCAT